MWGSEGLTPTHSAHAVLQTAGVTVEKTPSLLPPMLLLS